MARSECKVSIQVTTDNTSPTALAFSRVGKTYVMQSGQHVQALRGIDLSIPAGQLVVLVGPTGCGKTTLLNIAGGLLRPDQGRLILGVLLENSYERSLNQGVEGKHKTN